MKQIKKFPTIPTGDNTWAYFCDIHSAWKLRWETFFVNVEAQISVRTTVNCLFVRPYSLGGDVPDQATSLSEVT